MKQCINYKQRYDDLTLIKKRDKLTWIEHSTNDKLLIILKLISLMWFSKQKGKHLVMRSKVRREHYSKMDATMTKQTQNILVKLQKIFRSFAHVTQHGNN